MSHSLTTNHLWGSIRINWVRSGSDNSNRTNQSTDIASEQAILLNFQANSSASNISKFGTNQIPQDIINNIVSFLNICDRIHMAPTNHAFNKAKSITLRSRGLGGEISLNILPLSAAEDPYSESRVQVDPDYDNGVLLFVEEIHEAVCCVCCMFACIQATDSSFENVIVPQDIVGGTRALWIHHSDLNFDDLTDHIQFQTIIPNVETIGFACVYDALLCHAEQNDTEDSNSFFVHSFDNVGRFFYSAKKLTGICDIWLRDFVDFLESMPPRIKCVSCNIARIFRDQDLEREDFSFEDGHRLMFEGLDIESPSSKERLARLEVVVLRMSQWIVGGHDEEGVLMDGLKRLFSTFKKLKVFGSSHLGHNYRETFDQIQNAANITHLVFSIGVEASLISMSDEFWKSELFCIETIVTVFPNIRHLHICCWKMEESLEPRAYLDALVRVFCEVRNFPNLESVYVDTSTDDLLELSEHVVAGFVETLEQRRGEISTENTVELMMTSQNLREGVAKALASSSVRIVSVSTRQRNKGLSEQAAKFMGYL